MSVQCTLYEQTIKRVNGRVRLKLIVIYLMCCSTMTTIEPYVTALYSIVAVTAKMVPGLTGNCMTIWSTHRPINMHGVGCEHGLFNRIRVSYTLSPSISILHCSLLLLNCWTNRFCMPYCLMELCEFWIQ